MTLRAWSNAEGDFTIRGEGLESTYHHRGRLKAGGAIWNGTRWSVTNEQRLALGIEKMVWVLITGCHAIQEKHPVVESKAILGAKIRFLCGRCDSQGVAEVVEIVV